MMKKVYIVPAVDVISIETEQTFAQSKDITTGVSSIENGTIENEENW